MKFISLNGNSIDKNIYKCRVDWDKPCRSKFQFNVKQFFRSFWEGRAIYEEMPCVGSGSKIKVDLINFSDRIAVEADWTTVHTKFTPFFHGSRAGFLDSLKNDELKEKWCLINNLSIIRIYEGDLTKLSPEWIKENFGIDL